MNIKSVLIVIVVLAVLVRGFYLLAEKIDVLHAIINFLRPSFPKEIKLED